MTKALNTQSQKRLEESLASLFIPSSTSAKRQCVFLKSSSDEGVIRNGGRNGARLAPQSFLATFKRLTKTPSFSETTFQEIEVSDAELERKNFAQAQEQETAVIRSAIEKNPKAWFFHLGGGHDHAYPFLKAVQSRYKKIVVINIDAHADTRVDPDAHSGTPFRQFANESKGDFVIYQLGLHAFANSQSTLLPLEKGIMKIFWKAQLENLEAFTQELSQDITPDTGVFFSIDADALTASAVPGVSAPNGDGITLNDLEKIWKIYRRLTPHHAPMLGLYELNPVYDSLASLSMRSLTSFVFEALKLKE